MIVANRTSDNKLKNAVILDFKCDRVYKTS
jgi:hypothetical protein